MPRPKAAAPSAKGAEDNDKKTSAPIERMCKNCKFAHTHDLGTNTLLCAIVLPPRVKLLDRANFVQPGYRCDLHKL